MKMTVKKVCTLECILALVLCLAQFSDLLGQESVGNSDQYGVKAGINFAELFGDDAIPESDRKVGYSFGIYGTFKISKAFKVQPEVIWSLQGQKIGE